MYVEPSLLENMVFFDSQIFFKKTQFEQESERPFRHFEQVDFDMSTMIRVVFLLLEYGPFN
jgi:hypothetical protein